MFNIKAHTRTRDGLMSDLLRYRYRYDMSSFEAESTAVRQDELSSYCSDQTYSSFWKWSFM